MRGEDEDLDGITAAPILSCVQAKKEATLAMLLA
jgi:hypothetical protein